MPGKKTNTADERREKIRLEHWPDEELWTGVNEKGWFPALRTLPLIMSLLNSKAISESKAPASVYFELLSRQITSGIIEMDHEGDHAFAAGYEGARAIRTWQERMRLLEDIGFIRIVGMGNQPFKYVALVHPTVAVQRLYDQDRVSEDWWKAYCDKKIKTQEATFADREQAKASAKKVIHLNQIKKTGT